MVFSWVKARIAIKGLLCHPAGIWDSYLHNCNRETGYPVMSEAFAEKWHMK